MNEETQEDPKPRGRPAQVKIEVLRKCSVDGIELLKAGQVVKVSRELAKRWQESGVAKVSL